MNGSEISLLELIKSVDTGFFYMMVGVVILVVMTCVVSIYTAIRVDKIWTLIQRQHDIAEIKKEINFDLKSRAIPE